MRDEHKLMIQILMSKGLIGERKLKDIYKTVKERCDVTDNVSLNEFRNVINTKLKEVSMEIRQKPDEDTGEQMYALVQTMESGFGKAYYRLPTSTTGALQEDGWTDNGYT
eukprot:XP_011674105.1 PREDICTED: uncharacterized protein LOC105443015 [Strongylocentrotus purpuratus]